MLAIIMVPVFAEGQIGISLTPEWLWITSIEGQNSPYSIGMTRFMLTADGANYFGEKGGFGIEYGLGAIFPINQWQGNSTINTTGTGAGLVFRVGAGYRYEFSELFGLAAGLGLNGAYQPSSLQGTNINELNLFIYGRITADFTFLEFLRLNVGFAMGGPVYTLVTASSGGQYTSQSMNIGGFFFAPFAGVSYVY